MASKKPDDPFLFELVRDDRALAAHRFGRLLHLGTSSFSNKDWVGPFYPKGTRPGDFLKVYAAKFHAVEIDSTYYGVPAPTTVDKWRDAVPDGFVISAKFPRDIVHAGVRSRPDGDAVLDPDRTYAVRDEFLAAMARLGDRLGPMVIQFPFFPRDVFPRTQTFLDRLQRFLTDLPSEFRCAVEMRNRHWITPALADLCREHGAALTLVDQAWMPHGDEVERRLDPVTADFAYIRLLGDHKEIETITTTWDREVIDRGVSLGRWAAVIQRILEREVPVFVYVNNHYAGHAPATLRRLREMVARALGVG